MKTAPNIAPPSIHPVFIPSFKRPITNETTADINNTFNVGSSKHSKINQLFLMVFQVEVYLYHKSFYAIPILAYLK